MGRSFACKGVDAGIRFLEGCTAGLRMGNRVADWYAPATCPRDKTVDACRAQCPARVMGRVHAVHRRRC
jgi:hypothetical protein